MKNERIPKQVTCRPPYGSSYTYTPVPMHKLEAVRSALKKNGIYFEVFFIGPRPRPMTSYSFSTRPARTQRKHAKWAKIALKERRPRYKYGYTANGTWKLTEEREGYSYYINGYL